MNVSPNNINIKKSFSNLRKSPLLKSISVYTFFRVLNRTVPILLLPFLTHYLSPKDYGIVDFYLLWLLLFTPIIGFNTSASVNRLYYDKDELNYPNYISTVVYFNLFSTLFWLFFIFFTGTYVLKIVNLQIGITFFVFLILNSAFDQITIIQLSNWRVKNKPFPYGLLGFVRTLFEIGLSVILVKYYFQDWQGRIIGQFSGSLIAISIGLFFIIKEGLLKWTFNLTYLKKALSYGAPLILHSIGGILIGYSNRFFIYKFLGIEAAGIFAPAFQIGLAISLLQSSFNEAWVPYFFNLLKNFNTHKTRLKIVKISYFYFAGLTLVTVVIIMLLPFIYKLLGEEYNSGISLSIWIMMAFLFNGFYKMFGNYLMYFKKTKTIAFGTLFTLICNITLNYFLIPIFGLSGAAISLTISFFIQFLVFLIIVVRTIKMPWYFFKNV